MIVLMSSKGVLFLTASCNGMRPSFPERKKHASGYALTSKDTTPESAGLLVDLLLPRAIFNGKSPD